MPEDQRLGEQAESELWKQNMLHVFLSLQAYVLFIFVHLSIQKAD